AQLIRFGADDPSQGTGVCYSFATDREGGFRDDDLVLLPAVLPAASLAMMTHASYTIASGLLAAYLGGDAGRRVHTGAVERGSVESMRAVLGMPISAALPRSPTPGRASRSSSCSTRFSSISPHRCARAADRSEEHTS